MEFGCPRSQTCSGNEGKRYTGREGRIRERSSGANGGGKEEGHHRCVRHLRLDKMTIDQSRPRGGDLLAIARPGEGQDPAYELTIVNQGTPITPTSWDDATAQ
jgi:hypothetical protein